MLCDSRFDCPADPYSADLGAAALAASSTGLASALGSDWWDVSSGKPRATITAIAIATSNSMKAVWWEEYEA